MKRLISLFMAVLMVVGLLPMQVLAAEKPSGVSGDVYLAVYNVEGELPGEPSTHNSASGYINFDKNFKQTNYGWLFVYFGQYSTNAANVIKPGILDVMTAGSSDGTWGYVNTSEGVQNYFVGTAITDNEKAMIKIVKNCSDAEAENYDILWYVIKKQDSNSDNGWHIDGVIVNTEKYYVAYESNGATSGEVPAGEKDLEAGDVHTVSGNIYNLDRSIPGYTSTFVCWNTQPDGKGTSYYPDDSLTITDSNVTLYPVWSDMAIEYTATVKTYLNDNPADIEGSSFTEQGLVVDGQEFSSDSVLYISKDATNFIPLVNEEGTTGVYKVKVSANGDYAIYEKDSNDTGYTRIGTRVITIHDNSGETEFKYYSVNYDAAPGAFAQGKTPERKAYLHGTAVSAVSDVPVRTDGHKFNGWVVTENGVDRAGTLSAGQQITERITAPTVLTATWLNLKKVKVNVTINHNDINTNGEHGEDNSAEKGDVVFRVFHTVGGNSHLAGEPISLSSDSYDAAKYSYSFDSVNNVTKYTAIDYTLVDLEPEGTFTATAIKSDYDITVKTTDANGNLIVDESGNQIIEVILQYDPKNFDLDFRAKVDSSSPANLYPLAINTKVTYWGYDENENLGWQIISQQKDAAPVSVEIGANGTGSRYYPVWQYWSGTSEPYYYGLALTSIIIPSFDGKGTGRQNLELTTTDGKNYKDAYGIYNVTVTTDSGVVTDNTYGNGEAGGFPAYPAGSATNLKGSYYDGSADDEQNGILTAVIKVNPRTVTFDANLAGATVNTVADYVVPNVIRVPDFSGYTLSAPAGYVFEGWYKEPEFINKAEAGELLSGNVTLYAKWKAPITIKGTVTVDTTYKYGNVDVAIPEALRLKKAFVILEKVTQSGTVMEVEKVLVPSAGSTVETITYEFKDIVDDGTRYRIRVEHNNYSTEYNNNGDKAFAADEFEAIFASGSKEATVDAHLYYTPDSYDQELILDASQIGEGFRPTEGIARIWYKSILGSEASQVISQHTVKPYGKVLEIGTDGKGSAEESIWKYLISREAFLYNMELTKLVYGQTGLTDKFDNSKYIYNANGNLSNDAPFTVKYSGTTYWSNTPSTSGPITATLVPDTSKVFLNANGGQLANGVVAKELTHTWSHATAITEVPTRDKFIFNGWLCEADTNSSEKRYVNGKVVAEVHEDVTLVAQWLEDNNDDGVADKYQKTVTFTVVNGTWDGTKTEDIVYTVDLKTNGEYDENGTGILPKDKIPTGMQPLAGYTGGAWDGENPGTADISVAKNGNYVYTYKFSPRTDIEYTIRYLRFGTNTVLKTEETEKNQTFGTIVTKTAPAIAGYNVVDAFSTVSITLGADSSKNVITFYYNPKEVTVTAKYLEKDTNNVLFPEKLIGRVLVNSVLSLEDVEKEIEGYELTNILFDADNDGVKEVYPKDNVPAYYAKPDEDGDGAENIIIFQYVAKEFDCRIEYYYDGVLRETETVTAKKAFGSTFSYSFNYDSDFEKEYNGKDYIFDHIENNGLTVGTNAEENVIKVYYLSDTDNSNVPDDYEVTVTFHIVNGTWSDDSVASKPEKFAIKKFVKDEFGNGKWESVTPTLGTKLPTNMKPNEHYNENEGAWDENIDKDTPVTMDYAYTYAYTTLNEYLIVAEAVNGTVSVVENVSGKAPKTYNGTNYSSVVTASDADNTQFTFTANDDHILDYVTVIKGNERAVVYSAKDINNWAKEMFAGSTKNVVRAEKTHTENLTIVAHFAPDKNNNQIPDKYEKKVVFKVVNGTWNGTDSADKVYYFPILDENGRWAENGTATFTETVPTGMVAGTGYTGGAWDKTPADVDNNKDGIQLSGNAVETFTYGFEQIKIAVVIEVVGGTSYPAASVTGFVYDEIARTVTFTPYEGYILDSVTKYVGGTRLNDENGKATGINTNSATRTAETIANIMANGSSILTAGTDGTYSLAYDHSDNLKISVVFKEDKDNSGVADEYESTVTFRVVNGTWNGTDAAEKVYRVNLIDDQPNTVTVPTGMLAANDHNQSTGAWDVVPSGTVTKADDGKVYTYTFQPSVHTFQTASYVVSHHKQNPNGSFSVAKTETVVKTVETIDGVINRNQEALQQITYNAEDYSATHHSRTSNMPGVPDCPATITSEYTIDDSGVVTFKDVHFYYFLDSHTLTYDLNGGTATNESDFAPVTKLHGNTAKITHVPQMVGYSFAGWESDDLSRRIYNVGDEVVLDNDIVLKAQWQIKEYQYTVHYLDDDTHAPIVPTHSATANYGTKITVQQLLDTITGNTALEGYAFVSASSAEGLTIGINVTLNDINLYFTRDALYDADLTDDTTDSDATNKGDGIPDKYQFVARYVVSPAGAGRLDRDFEVVTIKDSQGYKTSGEATVKGSKLTPENNWLFENWTSASGRIVSETSNLAAQTINAVGGAKYVYTANLYAISENNKSIYKVEHYKWNEAEGKYDLADEEFATGTIGADVTATVKDYAGFAYNPSAEGALPSGKVIQATAVNGEITGMLVLKLFYDTDADDNHVPDKYQKEVTFVIVNGYWNENPDEKNSDPITLVLTLVDENGNYSLDGKAELDAPFKMRPMEGYYNGKWDKVPPEYVTGTDPEVFTFSFEKIRQTSDPIIIDPNDDREPSEGEEKNPATGAPMGF